MFAILKVVVCSLSLPPDGYTRLTQGQRRGKHWTKLNWQKTGQKETFQIDGQNLTKLCSWKKNFKRQFELVIDKQTKNMNKTYVALLFFAILE